MKETKRQNLPSSPVFCGKLWIVATPIGNLEDITDRARKVLKCVDVILCEDTRRGMQLLSALSLSNRVERFDAHASPLRISGFVERLRGGESFAITTDAGTPGMSDPGAKLVYAAHQAGIHVTPIPGASALTVFLSASGFSETAFVFRGFFPRKDSERRKELDLALASELADLLIWFESPERISQALSMVADHSSNAHLVAAKELTKLHEKFFSGNAKQVAERVYDEIKREGCVGEWCFGVSFAEIKRGNKKNRVGTEKSLDWVKTLACLIDARIPASDAARRVSQYFGIQKKTAYEAALKISGKKSTQGG